MHVPRVARGVGLPPLEYEPPDNGGLGNQTLLLEEQYILLTIGPSLALHLISLETKSFIDQVDEVGWLS